MMIKRAGSAARRRLEFNVIVDQVRRSKARFIKRLQKRIKRHGAACLVFRGATKSNGYARMNFRYKGEHVQIDVHRVFMILKNCAPIPMEYEAGHLSECKSRRCIRHLQLEHYADNACTNTKENARNARRAKHIARRATA